MNVLVQYEDACSAGCGYPPTGRCSFLLWSSCLSFLMALLLLAAALQPLLCSRLDCVAAVLLSTLMFFCLLLEFPDVVEAEEAGADSIGQPGCWEATESLAPSDRASQLPGVLFLLAVLVRVGTSLALAGVRQSWCRIFVHDDVLSSLSLCDSHFVVLANCLLSSVSLDCNCLLAALFIRLRIKHNGVEAFILPTPLNLVG